MNAYLTSVPEPVHFDDLKGGSTIATDGFLRVEEALVRAGKRGSIVSVVGAAGLGKTFSLRSIVRSMDSADAFWVEFDYRPTLRAIARALYIGLYGTEPQGTRTQIADEVINALAGRHSGRPLYLIVDEAQRLNRAGLEYLRYFHDHVSTGFVLVIAGGHGCWDVIRTEPMLSSRIKRPVRFDPLSDVAVMEAMPKYHPIYENCDAGVLKLINSRFAHGQFRQWASFTSSASEFMEAKSCTELDQDLALKIVHYLAGGEA